MKTTTGASPFEPCPQCTAFCLLFFELRLLGKSAPARVLCVSDGVRALQQKQQKQREQRRIQQYHRAESYNVLKRL